MRKIDEEIRPNSCLNKALNSELMFVLLGRDPAAPNVIRFWAQERIRMGLNTLHDTKIREALDCLEAVKADYGRVDKAVSTDAWDYHPDYSVKDWRYEVAEGYTKIGYWEWVEHKIEEELAGDEENQSGDN